MSVVFWALMLAMPAGTSDPTADVAVQLVPKADVAAVAAKQLGCQSAQAIYIRMCVYIYMCVHICVYR